MGLDITPKHSGGRQIIKAYGDGGFRIAGVRHDGSVLVFPDRTEAWPVTTAAEVGVGSLAPVIDAAGDLSVLLVGCGADFQAPPEGIAAALRDVGIVMEWMDTGAACRTFNVLLLEDRAVAAALIAVE